MKNNSKERLLNDVLKEGAGEFRQELFEESLRELKQRRDKAKRWSVFPLAIAAGFVLGMGLLFFNLSRHAGNEAGVLQARVPEAIRAPAYPQIEIITTTSQVVEVVDNGKYSTSIVENSNVRQPVEILADAELLALFPNKPAGLVANSKGEVRLVFLNPQDRASLSPYN